MRGGKGALSTCPCGEGPGESAPQPCLQGLLAAAGLSRGRGGAGGLCDWEALVTLRVSALVQRGSPPEKALSLEGGCHLLSACLSVRPVDPEEGVSVPMRRPVLLEGVVG